MIHVLYVYRPLVHQALHREGDYDPLVSISTNVCFSSCCHERVQLLLAVFIPNASLVNGNNNNRMSARGISPSFQCDLMRNNTGKGRSRGRVLARVRNTRRLRLGEYYACEGMRSGGKERHPSHGVHQRCVPECGEINPVPGPVHNKG